MLNSILAKALQYSLHGDSPLAAGLSFALKHLPETFAPNAPDVLSCLELRYKVSSSLHGLGRAPGLSWACAEHNFLSRSTGPSTLSSPSAA